MKIQLSKQPQFYSFRIRLVAAKPDANLAMCVDNASGATLE